MDPVQPTTPAEDAAPVSAPSDAVVNDSAAPAPESVITPDEPAVEAPAAEPAAWPTAPAAPEAPEAPAVDEPAVEAPAAEPAAWPTAPAAPSVEAPEEPGSAEPTPGL